MITSNGYVLDERPERLGRLEAVPTALRDDKDALWERLRRDGYLYLSDHLDPELVRDFRAYYFGKLAPTGLVQPGGDRDGIDSSGDVDLALTRRVLFDDVVPGDRYAELTAHPTIRGWFGCSTCRSRAPIPTGSPAAARRSIAGRCGSSTTG